jgi:IclR family pca regulon transcriptional regulator
VSNTALAGAAAGVRRAVPALDIRPMGDPDFMTSLARGLEVIRAFSGEGGSQTIAQLSRRSGIPRAAVRRCLHTLGKLGYVVARDRQFALGPRILALGHAYLHSTPLAAAAQPYLDRVSTAVGESSSLSVLEDGEIVYLARSTAAKRIMSVHLGPGVRLPASCTSMGRVLLAHLPPAELRAYLAHLRPVAFTDRTITSRERLAQVLEGVRRAGHAVVDQELEIGLRSIAVPVRDQAGRVVAAMNVGAQAARNPLRDFETRVVPHLRAAAAELGSLLPA